MLLHLIHAFYEASECVKFSEKMGYQGLVLKDRFQVERRMELLLCLATESRYAHNAGGSNVASDGVD